MTRMHGISYDETEFDTWYFTNDFNACHAEWMGLL